MESTPMLQVESIRIVDASNQDPQGLPKNKNKRIKNSQSNHVFPILLKTLNSQRENLGIF